MGVGNYFGFVVEGVERAEGRIELGLELALDVGVESEVVGYYAC